MTKRVYDAIDADLKGSHFLVDIDGKKEHLCKGIAAGYLTDEQRKFSIDHLDQMTRYYDHFVFCLFDVRQ